MMSKVLYDFPIKKLFQEHTSGEKMEPEVEILPYPRKNIFHLIQLWLEVHDV